MSGMRCWSFGPTGARCEVNVADHNVDDESGEWVHSYSTVWLDSESREPDVPVVRQVGTKAAAPVFEMLVEDTPDLDDAVPGTCFVCGCSKRQHEDGNGPCEEHDCRTYLE